MKMHKFSNQDGAVYVKLKEVIAIEAQLTDGGAEKGSRLYLRGGGVVLVYSDSDSVHKLVTAPKKAGPF